MVGLCGVWWHHTMWWFFSVNTMCWVLTSHAQEKWRIAYLRWPVCFFLFWFLHLHIHMHHPARVPVYPINALFNLREHSNRNVRRHFAQHLCFWYVCSLNSVLCYSLSICHLDSFYFVFFYFSGRWIVKKRISSLDVSEQAQTRVACSVAAFTNQLHRATS